MDQIFTNFLTTLGAISGSILGSKTAQKGDQEWDQFWNPLPRANRTPGVTKTGSNREGSKVTGCWIYIQKKKGRERALKGQVGDKEKGTPGCCIRPLWPSTPPSLKVDLFSGGSWRICPILAVLAIMVTTN